MRDLKGTVRGGMIGKITKDQCVPTSAHIENRRPDMVVRLEDEQRIVVLEVAVAWEPTILMADLHRDTLL